MPAQSGRLFVVSLLMTVAPVLTPAEDQGRLTVELRIAGGAALVPAAPVELAFRRESGAGQERTDTNEILRLPLSASALRTDVNLAAGRWSISARAPGLWASESTVEVVAGGRKPVTLTLWPSGKISGTVSPAKAAGELLIDFEPTPGSKARGPRGGIRCPVSGGLWSCDLPAGTLDVRLASRGFVPIYHWGLRVPKGGATVVGEFPLVRGASISGFVSADVSLSRCTVGLSTPEGGAVIPPQEGRPRPPGEGYSAPASDRGFFQLKVVPPGQYAVRAVCRNRRSALVTVRVDLDSESRLPEPIALVEPVFLDVNVGPAEGPTGRRWMVEVQSLADRSGEGIVSRQVSADGWVRFEDLSPGDYAVTVKGPGDERWFSNEVRVEAPSGQLEVRLDSVKLRGKVRVGSQPLRAKLSFGGEQGAESISLLSDETGFFEGVLPGRGGDKWPVDVRAENPPVIRHLPEVEIHRDKTSGEGSVEIVLDESTLSGVVVDVAGRPVERALVRVQPLQQEKVERWIDAATDAAGHFEITALPVGHALVTADKAEAIADRVEVALSEGVAHVRLVLRPSQGVSGRVVSAHTGDPIPGAIVLASSVDRLSGMFPARTQTDAEGDFTLGGIVPGARVLDLAVGAAGYVSQLQRIVIASDEPLSFSLSATGGGLMRLGFPEGWNPRDLSAPAPTLLHGGSTMPVVWLFPFAALNGVVNGDPQLIALPRMPAGPYSVCLMTYLERLRAIIPEREKCVSGELPDGGVLDLTVESGQQRSSER